MQMKLYTLSGARADADRYIRLLVLMPQTERVASRHTVVAHNTKDVIVHAD